MHYTVRHNRPGFNRRKNFRITHWCFCRIRADKRRRIMGPTKSSLQRIAFSRAELPHHPTKRESWVCLGRQRRHREGFVWGRGIGGVDNEVYVCEYYPPL